MTNQALKDQIAVVTGGSRGIGRAICKEMAAQGAVVVVSSRNRESCEKLVDEIVADGGHAHAVACDTGDLGQVKNLISEVKNQHQRLDTLVNNSAANPWFGPILDLEPETYQTNVDVNLRGTLFASIYAARIMREQGKGAIVHIGSINAVKPVVGQGIYSVCKGGVQTMTKAMAKEWAEHGIRVNEVAPGITKTDALASLFADSDELPDKWKQQVPMQRHAMPDEIAGAVAFLASDAASYITGARITADGGLTL